MSDPTVRMTFDVSARRVDAHRSVASCKTSSIQLDTDPAGSADAFNPAELLLTSLAACMIKNIERVAPSMHFQLGGVEVYVHGVRQESPPRMERIQYQIFVATDEPEHRLVLLHENVKKFGTVFNTVAPGTVLQGTLHRADSLVPPRRPSMAATST
jgi:uncharacterized OsmC-like protein